MDLNPQDWAWLFAVAALAGAVQGATGFGFGLLALWLPLAQASVFLVFTALLSALGVYYVLR